LRFNAAQALARRAPDWTASWISSTAWRRLGVLIIRPRGPPKSPRLFFAAPARPPPPPRLSPCAGAHAPVPAAASGLPVAIPSNAAAVTDPHHGPVHRLSARPESVPDTSPAGGNTLPVPLHS